ncbi:MAG TPA: FtsX-like permease family protein [Chloroflexota bacterium]|nr:FtsX-like permease family protein [Chloroflexota bacterium]
METLLGIPTTTVVVAVAILFALGLGSLTLNGLRNRLLLTLAIRNIPRRRTQSALIALGLALGTVIITTALNTGDTMSYTVRSLVAGTVGRTDEVIVQPVRDARRTGLDVAQSIANGTFLTGALTLFDQGEYERLASELTGDDRIAGLTPAIVESVTVANLAVEGRQAQVQLYGLSPDYPTIFGRFEVVGGRPLDLAELPTGKVLANLEAGAELQAEPGQPLRVYYHGAGIDLELAAIVNNGDLGGSQPVLVIPLGALQQAAGKERQINQILVANRGDRTSSVQLSEEVTRRIRPLLVDSAAAERLHALLRSDLARAELAASLPTLDPRTRTKVEALLRELDAVGPSPEFKALISDPELERRLFGLGTRLASLQGRPGTNLLSTSSSLRLIEVKRLSQDLADRWGGALTAVFVVLGLFSIATGVMLVVLIFVLLAAERRSELGITRALGAKSRHLIGMFLYEGLVYDLLGSAVGLAIGTAVGALLVLASANVLQEYGIELRPRVEPRSLLLAYCLGAVLTMASIVYGAWRASRVSVVAAIRNVPDPPRTRYGGRWLLLGSSGIGLGIAAAWWGARTGWALPMGVGVALVVLGLTLSARVWLSGTGLSAHRRDRVCYSLGGLLLVAYWLAPGDLLRAGGLRPLPRSMDLFFLAGLSVVLGTIWLIVFNLDLLSHVLTWLAERRRGAALVARTALAYLARRRSSTGLAIGMFALVIFSMVVASVLLTGTHRAYSDPEAMRGGFDVKVEQTVGGAPDLGSLLPELQTVKLSDLAAAARLQVAPAEAIQPGHGAQMWRPVGLQLLDDAFLNAVGSGFTARAPGYRDDAAVWSAVRESSGLAVVAGLAVRRRGGEPTAASGPAVGSGFRIDGVFQEDASMQPLPVWVRDTRGGQSIKLTVIGVLDPRASFGNGLFTSAASFAESGAPPPARSTHFLKLQPDVGAADTTRALNLALSDRGLRASEIGDEVRRIQGLRMLLNELLEGFIGVGLLAGIAGLGVISTRAVVERRQQIGVMRALGFSRRAVHLCFLLESSIVALLGIVAGIGLGLALSYRLVEHLGREYPEIFFSVPWGQIGLIATLAYCATMLTTLLPAYQAGRVSPAQALRL